MDAEGIVELGHLMSGNPANDLSQALDGHRSDLFSLCFGIQSKTGLVRW